MANRIEIFLTLLKEVLRDLQVGDSFVPLHEPTIDKHDIMEVTSCLDTGFVSTAGSSVEEFERKIASFINVKECVAVNSGTDALKLAVLCAGIEEDSEILIPAVSFIATANSIKHAGFHPHFVDVCQETMGIDASKLKRYLLNDMSVKEGKLYNPFTGRRIAAIVPMHCHGYACDITQICKLAKDFGLTIVEDIAESLGTFTDGMRHTGTFGLAGALSFNGNKIITTGGGGAVVTDCSSLAKRVRHLSTQAKVSSNAGFVHDAIGYNNRLPALNAALGVAQMKKLPSMLEKKRSLFQYFNANLALPFGRLFVPDAQNPNHWLITFKFDDPLQHEETELLDVMSKQLGIGTRRLWDLLPEQNPYKNAPCADLSGSKLLLSTAVALPSSPSLWIK